MHKHRSFRLYLGLLSNRLKLALEVLEDARQRQGTNKVKRCIHFIMDSYWFGLSPYDEMLPGGGGGAREKQAMARPRGQGETRVGGDGRQICSRGGRRRAEKTGAYYFRTLMPDASFCLRRSVWAAHARTDARTDAAYVSQTRCGGGGARGRRERLDAPC